MNDAPHSLPASMLYPATLEGIVALIFPIVAIIMGIGAVIVRQWLDYRRKRELFQLHHAERMLALEKGLDVPELPPEFFREYRRPTRATYLYRGLVWLFVGAGLGIAIFMTSQGGRGAALGFLPIGVGVANLLYYFLVPRVARPSEDDEDAQ